MRAYDNTPEWVKGLQNATATMAGAQSYQANRQQMASRKAAEQRAQKAFDLKLYEETMKLGAKRLQSDFQAWQLRNMQSGGATAITDAAEGIQAPGVPAFDPQAFEPIRNAVGAMPVEMQGFAAGYAQQRVQTQLGMQQLQEQASEIDREVASGGMDPAMAEELKARLEDAADGEVTPEAVAEILRQNRQAMAQDAAQVRITQDTMSEMDAMLTDERAVAEMARVGRGEWMKRKAKAVYLMHLFERFSHKIDPMEAMNQVEQTLYPGSAGSGALDPVRDKAVSYASKTAEFQDATGDGADATRQRVVEGFYSMLTGGNPDGSGSQGGGGAQEIQGQTQAPQGRTWEGGVALGQLPPNQRREVEAGFGRLIAQGRADEAAQLLEQAGASMPSDEELVQLSRSTKEWAQTLQVVESLGFKGGPDDIQGMYDAVVEAQKPKKQGVVDRIAMGIAGGASGVAGYAAESVRKKSLRKALLVLRRALNPRGVMAVEQASQ